MEPLGVLLLHPMNAYPEQEFDRRFRLFRFWDSGIPLPTGAPSSSAPTPPPSAVVGNAGYNADAALPFLENVASFSAGIDRVDLPKCRECGIDVLTEDLTDDVADLAVGLAISALRKIPQADRYVRAGLWKAKGDYTLTHGCSASTQRVSVTKMGSAGLEQTKARSHIDCAQPARGTWQRKFDDEGKKIELFSMAMNDLISIVNMMDEWSARDEDL